MSFMKDEKAWFLVIENEQGKKRPERWKGGHVCSWTNAMEGSQVSY